MAKTYGFSHVKYLIEREQKMVWKWMTSVFQEHTQSFFLCCGKGRNSMQILEKSSVKWCVFCYIIIMKKHDLRASFQSQMVTLKP